jgi:hypothetical protein
VTPDRDRDRDRPRVMRTSSRRAQALKVAIARALRERPASPAAPAAPAAAPAEEPSAPPPPSSIHSTDPRGIVIVPINSAPAATAAH